MTAGAPAQQAGLPQGARRQQRRCSEQHRALGQQAEFQRVGQHAPLLVAQALTALPGAAIGWFIAKRANAMLGVRWYLSERFVLRADWAIYTAFVSDARSQAQRLQIEQAGHRQRAALRGQGAGGVRVAPRF